MLETKGGPILVKGIRYVEDKSLTVYLDDSTVVSKDQLDTHDADSTDQALLVAREVQRRTGMVLGLPREPQKPHFATDPPNGIWMDHSHGDLEMETDRIDVAQLWLTLPDVIESIQKRQAEMESRLIDVIEALKRAHSAQEKIIGVLTPPRTEDDTESVGRAYR